MRRGFLFLLVTGLAVASAALASRLPEALARMELFRVREVRLQGNRFLTQEEAARTVALPPGANVWDDLSAWEERLAAHPLVKEAKVRRRLLGTLVAEVVEREPVALVPSPTLEPVDAEGRILPIDPARHRLDLPILTPWGSGGEEVLTLTQRRILAAEVARLGEADPELVARLSELSLDRRGDLRARIWEPAVTLSLPLGLPSRRIREGFAALADAGERFEGRAATDLDLRYQDQVVVRLGRSKGT